MINIQADWGGRGGAACVRTAACVNATPKQPLLMAPASGTCGPRFAPPQLPRSWHRPPRAPIPDPLRTPLSSPLFPSPAGCRREKSAAPPPPQTPVRSHPARLGSVQPRGTRGHAWVTKRLPRAGDGLGLGLGFHLVRGKEAEGWGGSVQPLLLPGSATA